MDSAQPQPAAGWRVRVGERDGMTQDNAGSSASWINLVLSVGTVTGFTNGQHRRQRARNRPQRPRAARYLAINALVEASRDGSASPVSIGAIESATTLPSWTPHWS